MADASETLPVPPPAAPSSASPSISSTEELPDFDSTAVNNHKHNDDILATCLQLIAGDGQEQPQVDGHIQPALESRPPEQEHLPQQQAIIAQVPQSLQSSGLVPPPLYQADPTAAAFPLVFAAHQRVVVVQQPPIQPQLLVACVPPRPVFFNNLPQPVAHLPQAAVTAAGTTSQRQPLAEQSNKSRKRRKKRPLEGAQEDEEGVDDPGQGALSPPEKKRPPHCEICGREFSAERFLRLHVAEIHEEGGKGRFTCGDCGRVYTRLRSLERHQNKHHLDGDPVCKICRKRVVNFDLHYRRFHCKSKSIQAGPRPKRKRKKRTPLDPVK